MPVREMCRDELLVMVLHAYSTQELLIYMLLRMQHVIGKMQFDHLPPCVSIVSPPVSSKAYLVN
jgi:hypothetical protein